MRAQTRLPAAEGVPALCSSSTSLPPTLSTRWIKAFQEANPSLDRSSLTDMLQSLRSLPESQRGICRTCCRLLPPAEPPSAHAGHEVRYRVTDELLNQPTTLLSPQDDKKSQAVSEESVGGSWVVVCVNSHTCTYSVAILLLHNHLPAAAF